MFCHLGRNVSLLPVQGRKPFRAFILRRSLIRTSARGYVCDPRGANNVEAVSRRVLFTLRVKGSNFPSADNNSPFGVFRAPVEAALRRLHSRVRNAQTRDARPAKGENARSDNLASELRQRPTDLLPPYPLG